MTTKIDFINDAFSRGRISGLTSNPTPGDISLALTKLEDLAQFWQSKNICTGYAFEDVPDPNTPHNVPRKYWAAYKSNLAVWLLTDFGKEPMQGLIREQRMTFSQMSADTANPQQTNYPSRQPRGAGNRWSRWNRYYHPVIEAPGQCATNTMFIGDVADFVEHFDAYLELGETIASYTLTADTGLTVISELNTGTDINYRIKAAGTAVLHVKIVATTTDSRVETRIINFTMVDPDA